MSLTSSEMTPADICAVTCGGKNNGDGGLFGGEGIVGLIALIIISGMFGFGGFGMGGGMGGILPWMLMSGGFGGFGGFGGNSNAATQADVQRAVDQQTLISKIDQQTYGISTAAYDINNTLQNGFSNAELSRCNQQAALMQQLYQIGYNQKDCCCKTERAIDGVNYNMATNTCALQNTMNNNTRDIIDNQNANSRAILDYLCQDKISTLQSENQALRLAASQSNQNAVLMAAMDANKAEILRRTGAECPTAAYIVQPPTPVTFPTNCCGQASFSGNNCGCNSGCGNCGF